MAASGAADESSNLSRATSTCVKEYPSLFFAVISSFPIQLPENCALEDLILSSDATLKVRNLSIPRSRGGPFSVSTFERFGERSCSDRWEFGENQTLWKVRIFSFLEIDIRSCIHLLVYELVGGDMRLNGAKDVPEEPFFDQLSKFIKVNETFLLAVIGKWTTQSACQFFAKIGVVVAVVLSSGLLCAYGRINGETFAGIIGVVLGYILGKGVL